MNHDWIEQKKEKSSKEVMKGEWTGEMELMEQKEENVRKEWGEILALTNFLFPKNSSSLITAAKNTI